MALALLIDGENITADYFPQIADRLTKWKDRRVARVFADFSNGSYAEWLNIARQFGLQPVMQLSGGKGKNSTDIAMTIAAMDILYAGTIDTVCLVSSDRDFVPLAQRLKVGGLSVIGMGRASTGPGIAEWCDQFIPLVPALRTAPLTATTAAHEDELRFMIDLISDVCDDGASINLSALGQALWTRNVALAERIGRGHLRKWLATNKLIVEPTASAAKTTSVVRIA